MSKQEETMTYKRMYYGAQIVEWNDVEKIARRYDVADVRAELRYAITTKVVEEKPIPEIMAEKFEAAWKHYGEVVVEH